jgi:hypothetical protein
MASPYSLDWSKSTGWPLLANDGVSALDWSKSTGWPLLRNSEAQLDVEYSFIGYAEIIQDEVVIVCEV